MKKDRRLRGGGYATCVETSACTDATYAMSVHISIEVLTIQYAAILSVTIRIVVKLRVIPT